MDSEKKRKEPILKFFTRAKGITVMLNTHKLSQNLQSMRIHLNKDK